MGEEGNNNLLAEVLGSLINNKNGDNAFGGNSMWAMFMFFILIWGGGFNGGFGGFGNRGFAAGYPATQNDIFASTAWGQTQDAIRDSIENTMNTTGRLAQDIAAGNANLMNNMNNLGNSVNQMNYNSLAQANATNQQIARTGFDLQTAVMAGNNLLQGAIMGGNNMLNSAIRETAGDTKLTFCQGNSALQAIIQGTGNNLQNAIYQTSNDTQRLLQGTANDTQRTIQGTTNETQRAITNTGNNLQTAIFQTANETQREIQAMNGDARLAICQSTNTLQNTNNDNANRTNATIVATGNNLLQGITGLGFLTQQKGDELKFELAKSTCDITSNNTQNTQKVLDKLCQMEAGMQAAKIQELQTANQALMLSNQVKDLQAGQLAALRDIQAGQVATAGYIINQVNPQARPAWIVSSPYQSVTTPTTGG